MAKKKLRSVNRPTGYEAWKDEKTFPKPNLGAIITILFGCFACGGLVTGTAFFASGYFGEKEPPPIPTLVVFDLSTPTEGVFNVMVMDQVNATATPSFTPDPREYEPTPNLQATLDFMISEAEERMAAQPTPSPKEVIDVVAVDLPPPVFCEGAPFEQYQQDVALRVTFEEESALRVLDKPRQPNQREPEIIKQLYDGDAVIVRGEPVCGEWLGKPVAYYPVDVPRWEISGFVGFGRNNDIWLEPAG